MTNGPLARLRADLPLFGKPVAPPPAPAPQSAPAALDFDLYLNGERVTGHPTYAEALAAAGKRPDGFVWLRLTEPGIRTLNEVAETFDLHRLAVEDAIHGDQRPKLEEFGDNSFMVLKTARYVDHERLTETSEVVDTGELMLFIGVHFVVSVLRGPECELDRVLQRFDSDDVVKPGPWAAVHAIVDHVVDEYLAVMASVQGDIAKVEQSIFASRRSGDVQRIYKLKREVMELRRAVTPLGRPLALLASTIPEAGAPDVPLALRPLFRDVQDHFSRVVDQLNAYDELLNSVISASLAEVAIRQNDDMRKISAWVAIAAVQTLIAGIYGMNFAHMPELEWLLGYPFALALMLTSGVLLHRAFRKSEWL